MNEICIDELSEYEKYVCIVADEMKIKESLEYNKQRGLFTEFESMGEANDHVSMLNDSRQSLASSVLAIMVRGIFKKFNYPLASFPVTSLKADQMLPLMLEATLRLENMGLKVLAHTFDDLSTNKRYIRLVTKTAGLAKHRIKNPFAEDDRDIFFSVDPPHLVKTTRNCLQIKRRHLKVNTTGIIYLKYFSLYLNTFQYNDQEISWKFIELLYHTTRQSKGLSTQHKLRYEHIHFNSFSKKELI